MRGCAKGSGTLSVARAGGCGIAFSRYRGSAVYNILRVEGFVLRCFTRISDRFAAINFACFVRTLTFHGGCLEIKWIEELMKVIIDYQNIETFFIYFFFIGFFENTVHLTPEFID